MKPPCSISLPPCFVKFIDRVDAAEADARRLAVLEKLFECLHNDDLVRGDPDPDLWSGLQFAMREVRNGVGTLQVTLDDLWTAIATDTPRGGAQ